MAPREDLITERGWEFIHSIPAVAREDPDMRAVLHCYAKESERLDASIEFVRAQLNPLTADDFGLALWEKTLRLPVRPSGASVAVRRTRVTDRYNSLDSDPAGTSWVQRISDRLGTGVPWSYEEHVPGDVHSPAPQVLRITLPYPPGSDLFINARAVIEEETPAELDFVWLSTEGFLWDVSRFDEEGFGI